MDCRFSRAASYNDPHAMFPSASKLFSGMNMGAHIAHDPCKRDKKTAEKERKKSSGVILEESEEGALSKLTLFIVDKVAWDNHL